MQDITRQLQAEVSRLEEEAKAARRVAKEKESELYRVKAALDALEGKSPASSGKKSSPKKNGNPSLTAEQVRAIIVEELESSTSPLALDAITDRVKKKASVMGRSARGVKQAITKALNHSRFRSASEGYSLTGSSKNGFEGLP